MAVKTAALRHRRRKTLFSFLSMFSLSLAIIFAALILSRRSTELQASTLPAPIVAAFDQIEVTVPIEPVAAGVKLSQVRFKRISFPKQQLPAGALQDVSDLLEAVTLAPLPANLPLFRENLSFTAISSNPVIDQIPAGMRAMTVKVDATAAVEGWAGSGSVVDVILVERERSSVVAEKVKVLSAERSVSPVEGAASPSVPSTVTLLVTQEQCLAINTAIPLGKIAFALRGSNDGEQWSRTSFSASGLKAGSEKNIASQTRVNGYVAVKEKQASRGFALNDGKWVKSEVIPEGFFVNSREK